MSRLSPQDIDQLTRMLSRALDFFQLRRMVYLATGEQLHEAFVGEGQPLRATIFELLVRLEQEPITDQFLDVVYREKPFQFELRAFIAKLFPTIAEAEPFARRAYSLQEGGQQDPAGQARVPGLERLVKQRLAQIDLRIWLDRMAVIERQVCRIEANDSALGTGFLVGPGVVLTNWHVVEEARKQGVEAALACRFDFRRLTSGGTDGGRVFPVAAIVVEKRCSSAEEKGDDPDNPPPAADELDYALLRLNDPLADRGHLRIGNPPPLGPGAPIVIVQHPDGDAIRFAIDTDAVIGLVNQGRRLRYTTNTEPGSSGSPCLSMDLDLVALHHLGDPRQGGARYNQGIPIALIRQSIADSGHAALLGG